MKSWTKPTPEQVKVAISRLGHPEQYRYFFSKLGNPEWAEPLREHAFFDNPPPPLRDEATGGLLFPDWPQAQYLARVAKNVPATVVSVVSRSKDNGNARVYESFIKALSEIPAAQSVDLSNRVLAWASDASIIWYADDLGKLMVQWAEGGFCVQSVALGKAILRLTPGKPRKYATTDNEEWEERNAAESHVREWDYERVLQLYVSSVVPQCGLSSFTLLLRTLNTAVTHHLSPSKEGVNDYSYIWRPAIEDHEQNMERGFDHLLVKAVRDAAFLLRGRGVSTKEIFDKLASQSLPIFKRLAIYFLSQQSDKEGRELASDVLLNRSFYDDVAYRHEYVLLLQAHFPSLSAAQKELLLDWTLAGPDLERARENHLRSRGNEPTANELAAHKKCWIRDRLTWFGAALPEKYKPMLAKLEKDLGRAEHSEFPAFRSSWFGPISPVEVVDLSKKSDEDLISYLREWVGGEERGWGTSREGLGRTFGELVKQEAPRISALAEKLKSLPPIYISHFFQGLRNALSGNPDLNWDAIFGLALWATEQNDLPSTDRDADEDYNWNGVRYFIAHFIEDALKESQVPKAARQTCWNVIERLTNDPDPTPEREERYGGSNMSPVDLAINTTRGVAIQSVMQYALWIVRQTGEKSPKFAHFEPTPEIQHVLEAHLNTARDPSISIRSIYGQYFPWIAALGRDWIKKNKSRIFPLEDHETKYWEAAWYGYLFFCQPYDDVLPLLLAEYSRAIEAAGKMEETDDRMKQIRRKLAEHVMVYFWRGRLEKGEERKLYDLFWNSGTAKLRAEALSFIGRSLSSIKEPIEQEVLDRLKRQWDERLTNAETSSDQAAAAKEAFEFGWSFASGKFEDEWSLDSLLRSLRIARYTEMDFEVVKRLAILAGAFPIKALDCLDILISGTDSRWGFRGWSNDAVNVLRVAYDAGDDVVKARVEQIVNDLVRRGFMEFRSVLPLR